MSSNNNNKASGGDDRFQKVKRDPRFWEMPEKERKIKIDKRFKSMFTDKRFKLKYTVDKRGRPVNHTSTEDLKRFYNLSDTEDDEEKPEDEEASSRTKVTEEKKKEKKKEVKEKSDSVTADRCDKVTKTGQQSGAQVKGQPPLRGARVVEEGGGDDDDDDEDEAEQRDSVAGSGDEDEDGSGSDDEDDDDEEGSDTEEEDLARGVGNVETSSDEDDEDEEEEDVEAILRREEEEITHDWGELCKDAPRNDQVSSRLAVCNMDWDKIKAKDLLFVFNSFKPKGGVVLSVKIYPSEFGKERRELERSQGPMELMALPDDPDNDTHEQQVYREKLRDYQFKRLQYFYGVVECDSASTADHIYQTCDRSEYESSCSVLDLRFIPEDVSFEEEEPTDIATDVGVSAYTPKVFICAASGTSTVKLTWDENDHDRVTALSKDFKKEQLLDMDFNAYLASSSEEEEEEEEEEEGGAVRSEEQEKRVEETKEDVTKPRQKKQRAEEQINKYRELLKGIQDKEKKHDKHMEMEITWTPGLRETTEQLVKQKKKMEAKDQLTPWEGYLEKKKQKKKLRKAKNKKQEQTEEDLSDDDVPSDVDLNDPFFTEELGSTEVKKKKTKGKKSKKEEEERTAEEEEEVENRKAEMALLMDDEEDGERKHFNYDEIVQNQNLSKKKRKNLQKKNNQPLEEDSFQVDVKDPRFQAVFTSALFNLDPSDPNYKKTRATQSLQAEKRRRREQGEQEEEELRKATPTATPATQEARRAGGKRETEGGKQEGGPDPSLSLLVKSIKNKTQQFQARKKLKTT